VEVAMSYWWCLKHQRVEGEKGCAHATRLGPYETEAEAAAALDSAHRRSAEWDLQDEEYRRGSADD
jgi:hypothetical protein